MIQIELERLMKKFAEIEASKRNHPVYEVWMCGNMGRARMKVFNDLQEAFDYKKKMEEPHISDEFDPTEFAIIVEEEIVSLNKETHVCYY